MADAFSQFHHAWTDRLYDLYDMPPPPHGSQDIRSTDDGADGANGKPGKLGSTHTGPGPGQRGFDGGSSDDLDNTADALIFHKANPLGFWALTSTTGFGGDGGRGGNAGGFNSTHDSGPWPKGGDGGNGGDSGMATTTLAGHTIWGARGDRLTLSIGAESRDGGKGGDGGNGDGESGPVVEPGGAGGNGGVGGSGGNAVINITNDTLAPVGNAHSAFPVEITAIASGGDGGDGGFGGLGGAGSPHGADGAGGAGGRGGDARIILNDLTVKLTGAAHATSLFQVEALAYAGDGGDGASTLGHFDENSALGGQGGDASIVLANIHVTGGAEDDTVRLILDCFRGFEGMAGDGTFPHTPGGASYTVEDNVFNGGGGNNTLSFSDGVEGSDFVVNVNLVTNTFTVNGAAAGTLDNFDNVTGAGGDDHIIGNNAKNVLGGFIGSDTLHGAGGDDVFAYASVFDSYSTYYDWIDDLKLGSDTIALPFAVTRVDREIKNAVVHSDNFDSDIAAAASQLHRHAAVLVQAEYHSGPLTEEKTFLVIDADGMVGYQRFDDMVIDVTGVTGRLTVHSFIEG